MNRHFVRLRARSRLAAALVAGLVAGAVPAAAQEAPDGTPIRVAVVNIEYVAVQSPAGRALQTELTALQQEMATELQRLQGAVDDIEARIAAADSLTADQSRQLEREYQDALTNIQRYQQDMQERAQTMRSEGLARIQEEIGPIIEALQTEQSIDLVLNSGNAAVVLFSERVDMTQTVLDRLQAAGGG
jgi:Skp family chaperone for outer membrane proteins